MTTALGSRRDRAGGAPQLIVRPVILSGIRGLEQTPRQSATSASICSSCLFRLLLDRVEVGHHLALTIGASVSEMPMPQRAFSGERRCRERRLAKQGGLPDQASPNHPIRALQRRTLDVWCPAQLAGFPLARFRCRRTPAGPMQSDARAECLGFLRDSSGDAPTCSDIGNHQILRRWLCQLDASEVPQLLDANRPSLWFKFRFTGAPRTPEAYYERSPSNCAGLSLLYRTVFSMRL